MGGQSLATDGTVATLDQQWLEADTARKTYRVAAGTRWSTVIAKLDALGFSPAVMQSNNDFGVASTFSVNAHGWPVPFSGCGSTVRAMTMLLADGTAGHVLAHGERRSVPSRDGWLRAVRRDHRARARHGAERAALADASKKMSGLEIGARFAQQLASDPTIQMAYGRMDVALDRFFERGAADHLSAHRRPERRFRRRPAPASSAARRATSSVRRSSPTGPSASAGGPRPSSGRWLAGNATRNSLMNEPVITLDDRDPFRTDILHEYFVAPARFAEFVDGVPGR